MLRQPQTMPTFQPFKTDHSLPCYWVLIRNSVADFRMPPVDLGDLIPGKTCRLGKHTWSIWESNMVYIYMDIIWSGGIPTPLKNDGLRQLGWMEIPN